MSNEVRVLATTGQTLYFVVQNQSDQVWYISGAAWETWGNGSRDADDYDYALEDLGGGLYTADFPTAITTPGRYTVVVFEQAGGSPVDGDNVIGGGSILWDGDSEVDIAASTVGPGAYTVTLTIRTTGGTPIPGVTVWVSTTNSSATSDVVPKITDASGQVSWLLDYTTYYIFCDLAGYTFNAASMTPASGSVSFTKDIGAAASSGSSANYSESFLTRAVAEVRRNIDEPDTNAKYSDATIIKKLEQAYMVVIGEVNRNNTTPVVAKFDITIDASSTAYALPPGIGSIYGVYQESSEGLKVYYDSRAKTNPLGQGVWIEGNLLKVQTSNYLAVGTVLTVEYIPNGIARLHNGLCTLDSDGDTATFGGTPNAGTLDTHQNAYVGSIFRVLKVTGTTTTGDSLQERMISAYTQSSRAATLGLALSPIPTTDDGSIYYEIAPAIHKGMDEVVALYTAYMISNIEGNPKRSAGLLNMYRDQMRNLRLTSYYSSMPEAKYIHGDTYKNRRYRNPRRR